MTRPLRLRLPGVLALAAAACAGAGGALGQEAPLAVPMEDPGVQAVREVPATTAGFSDDFLPGFLTSGGPFDAPEPDVVFAILGGVQVGPAYLGSDEYEVRPAFRPRIDFIRFPGGLEFGSSQTVGFRTGPGLSGSIRVLGKRDSDDYEQIEGLDDIDLSFEAGLGFGYEQRNYRFFADVRYGFIGHNTFVADIGADGITYPIDGLTLTAGPRLQVGTDRFNETYFGISAEESEASGLPAFAPDGGVYAAGMEVSARYLLNERWGVEGTAIWNRLLNDAADSPITEEGSADQYTVRVGITRRISLDF